VERFQYGIATGKIGFSAIATIARDGEKFFKMDCQSFQDLAEIYCGGNGLQTVQSMNQASEVALLHGCKRGVVDRFAESVLMCVSYVRHLLDKNIDTLHFGDCHCDFRLCFGEFPQAFAQGNKVVGCPCNDVKIGRASRRERVEISVDGAAGRRKWT